MNRLALILFFVLFSALQLNAQQSVRLLELNTPAISSFSFLGSKLVVATGGGKVYFKDSSTDNWFVSTPFGSSSASIFSVEVFEGQHLLANNIGENAGLKLSPDGGQSWVDVEGIPRITNLLRTASGAALASTFDGVLYSADKGGTWTSTDAVLKGDVHFLGSINDSLLVAASEVGPEIEGRLSLSWNGGLTWQNSDETYQKIGMTKAVAQTDSGFVLLGRYAREYVSLPDKESVQIPKPFSLFHFASFGTMWFANFSGYIHRSMDEGNTWVSTQIEAFDTAKVYPTSDSTFYLVRSNAIDYIELSSALYTSVETQPESQSGLLTLYPNPASREVTVESARNISCDSIRFIDLLGREIAPIVSTPGARKRCTFNIEQMPTGNYFVQAQAGFKIFRGSLIVIR